jgi:hypothetical protein
MCLAPVGEPDPQLPGPRMQPTGRKGAPPLARHPPVAPLRKHRIVRALA